MSDPLPLPMPLPCSGDRSAFWEELHHQASIGASVTLLDVDALDPGEASRVLDFFLHDPMVTGPIEPFAALLSAMLRKQEMGLWDLDSTRSGAEASREAFLLGLPREYPQCLQCACFPLCQGYGAWAGSCETWRTILSGLAVAARELSALRRRHVRRSERRYSDDHPHPS
jgi:hypothetical protein